MQGRSDASVRADAEGVATSNLIEQSLRVIVDQFHERYLDDAASLLSEKLRTGSDSGLNYRASDETSARAVIADALDTGPAFVALDNAALVGFMIALLPSMPGGEPSRLKIVHHAAHPPAARDAYRRM